VCLVCVVCVWCVWFVFGVCVCVCMESFNSPEFVPQFYTHLT